jgi:ribosomal protein L13
LVRGDGSVKVREIAEVMGIAKITVHEIIADLNSHKVLIRCVEKMLTKEHKSKRTAALLENLHHYQDGETFVESIIMGDETWVYEFTQSQKEAP